MNTLTEDFHAPPPRLEAIAITYVNSVVYCDNHGAKVGPLVIDAFRIHVDRKKPGSLKEWEVINAWSASMAGEVPCAYGRIFLSMCLFLEKHGLEFDHPDLERQFGEGVGIREGLIQRGTLLVPCFDHQNNADFKTLKPQVKIKPPTS